MTKVPVVNLRGTNGSGKTYLVRRWMEKQGTTSFPRVGNLLGGTTLSRIVPEYYCLGDGGRIIGGYNNECGGCDMIKGPGIKSGEETRRRILQGIHQGSRYVLFEGLLISGSFGPWHEFNQSIGGGMVWVYLDTPYDVCLKRTRERHGGFVKEIHIKRKFDNVIGNRRLAEAAHEKVVVLHWERAWEEFSALMKSVIQGAE